MTQAMVKQFNELKKKHPDAILLFRCGDFYEAYEQDAEVCAKLLGLTLTVRSKGKQMVGFPHHALDMYLPKLIRAGKRVALCDQLEEPARKKQAKRVTNVKLPALTRKQYDLLCECIRYRCADNSRERTEAEKRRQFTAWYEDMEERLKELKELIYDK